jgi:hypothetical protein
MSNGSQTLMAGSTSMDFRTRAAAPDMFMPHPGFSDNVNRNIVSSEIEGGVCLDQVSEGTALKIETEHHWYTIVKRSGGEALISGHAKYCPEPCR